MDEKEIILRQIANTGMGIPLRRERLLWDLQDNFNLDPDVVQELLQECLFDNYISVHNDKYSITQKGLKFLENKDFYEFALTQVDDTSFFKRIFKPLWRRLTAIIIFIAALLSIIWYVVDFFNRFSN